MPNSVIDTNVLIVANGKNTHASLKCQLACVKKLEQIKTSGTVILDTLGHIFSEYSHHLNFSGQPGTGDMFFQFLHFNFGNPTYCKQIDITANKDTYNEFPADDQLNNFDPSDHKFVATAISCVPKATILNATDSDWEPIRQTLNSYGIPVLQLCPEHMNKK